MRSEAKKKKPAITRAMISKIKHGIAPWRGIAEVLVSLAFFLIFGAAIQNEQGKASTGSDLPCLLLEQAIKRGAGIIRVARRRHRSVFPSFANGARGQSIARNCHSRRKKPTRVRLIFERNANRNRPYALESGGGLEIHALLANSAMPRGT